MDSAELLQQAVQLLAGLKAQGEAQARQLAELKTIAWHHYQGVEAWKQTLALQAIDQAILLAPRYQDPKCLGRFQAQVYSQNAEDGIIAEIFRRIGTTDRRFMEFGVGDGSVNNTRFLLQLGWTGAWMEGGAKHAEAVRTHMRHQIASGSLRFKETLITKENINALFAELEIPRELDFLSLDIDMNTSHVWEALEGYRPRVVCAEYNASFPPSVDFAVPYRPDAAFPSSNYFGASLKTLERIGQEKGYSLVGCDFNGINAFFVRSDLCGDLFLSPFTAEFHYEPPRYAVIPHRGHAGAFPR